MKRFIFLPVFVFIIFSCSKNNKENSANEEKYELADITEKDTQYSDEEIHDKEIYEKLLGDWNIFEKNGEIIFKNNIPKEGNPLGFKKDFFYQYYDGGGIGGWELEWRIEKGKLYITNNNPDNDNIDFLSNYINFVPIIIGFEILGSYNVEFFNEKIIILYHENGNIYKCYKSLEPDIEFWSEIDSFTKNKSFPNIRYTYDTTLLMNLIYYNRPPSSVIDPSPPYVLYLLENGIDINGTNMFGQTALHYAAWKQMPKLIEKLIEKGADVNLVDDFGQTPLDIAELHLNNDGKSIRVLKSHGAINNKK